MSTFTSVKTNNVIDTRNVQGLEELSHVLLQALELENCPICLKKLQEPVLLWPCSHRFCKCCISVLHKNVQGEEVKCPLCKGETTRYILLFENEQKEYRESLQMLIGAINHDLGFEITCYQNEVINKTPIDSERYNISSKSSSPIKKTRKRQQSIKLNKKLSLPYVQKEKDKRITRSSCLKNTEITKKNTLETCFPEIPQIFDSKDKKVKDWLEGSKFSQAEQDFKSESIKIDLLNPEHKSSTSSEDQLLSITQVGLQDFQTSFEEKLHTKMPVISSDIEETRKKTLNEVLSKSLRTPLNCKRTNAQEVDKFDKLLNEEIKYQPINSTFARKPPWTCNRHREKSSNFDVDLLKTTEKSSEQYNTNQTKQIYNLSHDTLEDFSSGSGEEWTPAKKKRNVISKRNCSYSNKKTSHPNKNYDMLSKKSLSNNGCVKAENSNKILVKSHIFSYNSDTSNDCEELKSNNPAKLNKASINYFKERIKEKKEEIPKFKSEKNESKESLLQPTHEMVTNSNAIIKHMSSEESAYIKENQLSHGWSRLNTTKKEFHMAGKNKLNLKTLSKSKLRLESKKSNKSFLKKKKESSKNSVKDPTLDINKSMMSISITTISNSPLKTSMSIKEDTEAINLKNNEHLDVESLIEEENVGVEKQSVMKTYTNKTDSCSDLFFTPKKFDIIQKEDSHKCVLYINNENKSNVFIGNVENCKKQGNIESNKQTMNKSKYFPVELEISNISDGKNKDISQEQINESTRALITIEKPKTNMGECPLKKNDEKIHDLTIDSNRKKKCDSGIHNESAFSLPVQNKICQDAEVQTSPEMMHSYIKGVVKDLWGIDLNQLIENSLLSAEPTDLQKKHSYTTKKSNYCIPPKDLQCENVFHTTVFSQDSDKENKSLVLKKQNNDEYSFDPDFVLGTEDRLGQDRCIVSHHIDKDLNTQMNKGSTDSLQKYNASKKSCEFEEVDPFADTQLYKAPMQKSKTSTNSASLTVTNVGDVELKMVSNILSEDCLFIEGTPDLIEVNKKLQQPVLEKDRFEGVAEHENNRENSLFKTHSEDFNKSNISENKPFSSISKNLKEIYRIDANELKKKERQNNTALNEHVEKLNIDKNEEIEEHRDEVQQYCFASSLLNAQQNRMLDCVLTGLNIPFSKTVGPHISHLIVATSKDGRTQNTYKVLYAMALHKPIIRYDWIEHVLKKGGTVPIDMYLAFDPRGECGILRAQQDKDRLLLHDFAIHLYNVIDKVVQKDQIEELIILCGGTIVSDLNDFHNIPSSKLRVIILSEPYGTQADWREKFTAVEVSVDWLYCTIGCYRVVPILPFIVNQTNAISFLKLQAPQALICDLMPQGQSASS